MNETASVYRLISSLCSSLVKESDNSDEGLSLSRAKQLAFAVLLKNHYDETSDSEKLLQELQFASFELQFANRNDESKEVNDFIDKLEKKWPEIDSICWLLLHLKNIDPEKAKHQVINIIQIFVFSYFESCIFY